MTAPRCVSAAIISSILCACPVSLAPLDQVAFSCHQDDDCAVGYVCVDDRCALIGQDAGSIVADNGEPDSRLDDASRADANRSDGNLADASAGDASQVDASQADASQVDTSQVDASQVDAVAPDSSSPDSAAPDALLPDSAMPDTSRPDTSRPDSSRPDACQSPTGPPWWDTAYTVRYPIDVAAAPEGYTVELQLSGDGASALHQRSGAGGEDLRVVRHDGAAVELDRDLIAFTASSVFLRFKIQEAGGFAGGDQRYFIYLRNSSPPVAPSDLTEVYLFFDDFEDFAAGDDGAPTYAQSPSTAWRVHDDGGNKVLRAYDSGRMLLNIVGHDRQAAAVEARMKYASLDGTDFCGFMFWGQTLDRDTASATAGSVHGAYDQAGISSWSNGGWSGLYSASSFTPGVGDWLNIAARFVSASCSFSVDNVVQGSLDYQPTTGLMLGLGCFETDVYFDELKIRMAQEPEPVLELGSEERVCE